MPIVPERGVTRAGGVVADDDKRATAGRAARQSRPPRSSRPAGPPPQTLRRRRRAMSVNTLPSPEKVGSRSPGAAWALGAMAKSSTTPMIAMSSRAARRANPDARAPSGSANALHPSADPQLLRREQKYHRDPRIARAPASRPLRRRLRLLQVEPRQDPGLGPPPSPAAGRHPKRRRPGPAGEHARVGAARLLAPGAAVRRGALGRRRRGAARRAAAGRPAAGVPVPVLPWPHRRAYRRVAANRNRFARWLGIDASCELRR